MVVKPVRRPSASAMILGALGMLFVGCGAPPGQPRAGSMTPAPGEVVEFAALYAENCAGCHGANGRGGAAIALANPVYLAIVDERALRATIADGVRGTSMPAFAQRAGGMLTETQIEALVSARNESFVMALPFGPPRPSAPWHDWQNVWYAASPR